MTSFITGNLLALGLPVLVSLGVLVFAKVCPKQKISGWLNPIMAAAGTFTSKFLVLRLGKGSAEKVEQGIIATVLHVIIEGFSSFEIAMLNDNETKKQ